MDLLLQTGLLVPLHDVHQAPFDSYIVSDMSGGLYYILLDKYNVFITTYLQHNSKWHFTMNLSSTVQHNIIFDIDVSTRDGLSAQQKKLDATVATYLREYAIPTIWDVLRQKTLTIILSRRIDGNGAHMHLPEYAIGHDDYILLCQRLQHTCNRTMSGIEFKLDIPTHFTLSKSHKVGVQPYTPSTVYYKDETGQKFEINLVNEEVYNKCISNAIHKFKKFKINEKSVFKFMLSKNRRALNELLQLLMMPVITNHCSIKTILLGYSTQIAEQNTSSQEEVANFLFVKKMTHNDDATRVVMRFLKNTIELEAVPFVRTMKYLKINFPRMEEFCTNNFALKQWWKYMESQKVLHNANSVFVNVNEIIREHNVQLRTLENPLAYIMEYNDCCYFVPLFYTLYNVLQIDAVQLIAELNNVIKHEKGLAILDKMQKLSKKLLQQISCTFSVKSFMYCSLHLKNYISDLEEKFQDIFEQMKHEIENSYLSTNTENEKRVIERIIDVNFPLMMLKCNDYKRGGYQWNCIQHCWNYSSVIREDVKNLVFAIASSLQTFIIKNTQNDKFKCKNLNSIVSSIYVKMTMSNVFQPLDVNKWFLNTPYGVLDIVTGEFSGKIPEHYLSNAQLSISIDNKSLSMTNSSRLISLLWNKQFFEKYLSRLQTDTSIHSYQKILICTLQEEENCSGAVYINNDSEKQMIKFYIHLCKFLNFNFEEMDYLMDIISSLFIATNYNKLFIVFHGEKNNGKTKFVKMIQNVLGGYAQPISAHALINSEKKDTSPDIAKNIYSKRLLIAEEMTGMISQNFIKLITGNNSLCTRSLYETSRSDIPTSKILATTNTSPECIGTPAFWERIVVFLFNAQFVKNAPESISDQIEQGIFQAKVDESIVQCNTGIFYHIMIRLKEKMNDDGYLYCVDVPQSLVDYKSIYLKITDIYTQFKSYADIQEEPSQMITTSELRSAIRRFLVHIKKSTSIQEDDIIQKFADEYKHLKFVKDFDDESDDDDDENDNDEVHNAVMDFIRNDNGEVLSKIPRKSISIICYKDISIKNPNLRNK